LLLEPTYLQDASGRRTQLAAQVSPEEVSPKEQQPGEQACSGLAKAYRARRKIASSGECQEDGQQQGQYYPHNKAQDRRRRPIAPPEARALARALLPATYPPNR
jgi:hypothetical protein